MEESEDDSDHDVYNLFCLKTQSKEPFRVELTLNGIPSIMEIDTGAAVSVMSESRFKEIWSDHQYQKLTATQKKIRTYSGELIEPIGEIKVSLISTALDHSTGKRPDINRQKLDKRF